MVKSLKVIRFEWSEQKKTIIALITPNSDSSIDQYINSLKKEKSKYIIYNSPYFKVDKIPTNKRLKVVDSYIKQNYYEVYKYRDYSIVKKKE